MSSIKIDTTGLDKLIDKLSNLQNSQNEIEGSLFIDIPKIKSDIVKFNEAYNTNLELESSDDEISTYFTNSYVNLVQQHLLKDTSAKDEFNLRYSNYARVE